MDNHEHQPASHDPVDAHINDPAKISTVHVACASLVVLTIVLATYWPVLNCHALSFDDNDYFTENALVTHPSVNSAGRFLTEVLKPSTVRGYYQPLAMISLMLDYALGARPADLYAIQRTSLALHAANSVLVALLMLALFRSVPAAIIAGLLFGLHPAAVESVPWLAQRKSLLSTFFALACLLAYCRYARIGGAWRYAVVALLYVLSLMSKPTSTPLPLLLLLLDAWPLKRLRWRTVVEKIPLFAIAAVFSVITVISQSRAGGAQMPHEYGPLRIPMILAHNISFYFRHLFWPGDVPNYYLFPSPFTPGNPAIISGFLITAALVATLILSLRWTRAWVCGGLFLFVALSPTLGVIGFTDTIASNRFLYLPMVGALLPIAYYAARGWTRPRTTARTLIVTATMFACALGAIGTRRGLSFWSDSVTHFAHLVQVAPDAPKVRFSYGEALDRAGYLERAEVEYRAAIALRPGYSRAHNNLAVILAARNQLSEALPHYADAVRYDTKSFKAYNNYGVALIQAGRNNDAIHMLTRAVEINPNYADARFNLGRVLGSQNRIDEAISQFQAAHELDPDDAEILYNLGLALGMAHRWEAAATCYRQVQQRNPNYPGIEQALKQAEENMNANATTRKPTP